MIALANFKREDTLVLNKAAILDCNNPSGAQIPDEHQTARPPRAYIPRIKHFSSRYDPPTRSVTACANEGGASPMREMAETPFGSTRQSGITSASAEPAAMGID